MPRTVTPSREDPVVLAATEVLGGPIGEHAARPNPKVLNTAAWLGLFALIPAGLALLVQQHCRGTLWGSPNHFTHICYSDIPVHLPTIRDLGYVQDQPIGVNLLMHLVSSLIGHQGTEDAGRWAFDAIAPLIVVSLVVLITSVRLLAGRRPWDAAMVALSPALIISLFISVDMVAVALAIGGLAALARNRPILSGVLIGLAGTMRPLALLLLVAVLIVASRTKEWGPALRTGVVGLAVWLATNVLGLLALRGSAEKLGADGIFELWSMYWKGIWETKPTYGSLALVSQLLFDTPVPMPAMHAFTAGLIAAVLVGAFGITHSANRTPRVASIALLLVVGVLAALPANSIQAGLWVLPLLVLAYPRWWLALVWGALELVYAVVTWLYVYTVLPPNEAAQNASRGATPTFYSEILILRVAAWTLVWFLVLRSVIKERNDPVRAPKEGRPLAQDDPALGKYYLSKAAAAADGK